MLKVRLILFSLLIIFMTGCNNTNIALVDEPLDILQQDYFGEIQSYFLTNVIQTTNLTQDALEENKYVIVDNVTGCAVGQAINFYDNESLTQGLIEAITGNNISFEPKLDKTYNTSNSYVECARFNMNVNGAVNPTKFSIYPPKDVVWDIESNYFQCKDNLDWDSDNFCGRASLSNGIVAGVNDGYHKHLFLIYDNAGFGARGFEIYDYEKAPAGVYGYLAKLNLEQNFGAIIRLNGSSGDTFTYLAQDDFTSVQTLASSIGGHRTDD